MGFLILGRKNGMTYDYHAPESDAGFTFVCFNPLTGDRSMWEDGIKPYLLAQGHGILTFNMRGQSGSLFTPGSISEASIIDDAVALLQKVKPQSAILTGHSIGGLFAAKAFIKAGPQSAKAIIFINTLRKMSARLAWTNDALIRAVETGGMELLRDMFLPQLMSEQWLGDNRGSFLKKQEYQPIAKTDGALALLKAGGDADWSFDWSGLELPILNITGLQDNMFRNDTDIAAILQQLPDAKSVSIANAGHMIPAETPEQLAQEMLTFAGGLT